MRKETIIKYEKEFLAWCKEEPVLLGAPTSMHDRTLIWREVRDFNDWKHLDAVYVLNDSYSVYRKALAEGKTIQYYVDGFVGWQDVKSLNQSCMNLNSFRIKPEEPKFKVGDWVILNGKYKRVTKAVDGYIDSLDNQVAVIMKEETLELWEPKLGEWCWFWNFNDMPTLEQFSKYHDLDDHLGNYETLTIKLYQYCEPFIGQLPTRIKD